MKEFLVTIVRTYRERAESAEQAKRFTFWRNVIPETEDVQVEEIEAAKPKDRGPMFAFSTTTRGDRT